jgi:Flp pilus assembly pilin Flp
VVFEPHATVWAEEPGTLTGLWKQRLRRAEARWDKTEKTGESRGAHMSEFRREIRGALRYEHGLAVKALVALLLMAVIVVLRTLYFS